jgi:glycosyltransferase involved in cell wall biosynthesis
MRVLCLSLSTFDKVGGVQTFNKFFYEALKENKIQYTIISLHDKNSPCEYIRSCNSNYIKFLYLIFKFHKRNNIIIWQHVSLTIFIPILKLLGMKSRNIITVYGTEVWGKKLSFLKRIGFQLNDAYWCISNFTANEIFSKFKIEKNKINLLPCCLKIPNKIINEKNPYQNKMNILTILRLDKSGKLNAIFEILKAMEILRKEFVDLHFTILGEGNYKTQILKIIKKNKLQDKVSLLGFKKNTKPFLQHCDLFTLNSPLEGFGIVYLEAMLYKKACIASKGCGSEDVVLNNKTGYSIPLNDINQLVNVIRKILVNKQLSKKMGLNGYNHLIENFSFEKFKENQMRLLKSYYK